MTKDSARKKAIRARMRETGEPYTEAARRLSEQRDGQGEQGSVPGLQVVRVSWEPEPVQATWDTPRTYRCHHCGAAGELTRQIEADSDIGGVLEDGSTYLLGYCPACLPPVPGRGWTDAHREHSARGHELAVALRSAIRSGQVSGARSTDFYLCSISDCHRGWQIDQRITLPAAVLYDRSNDLYTHPCPDCWRERGPEGCAPGHQAKARELARYFDED